ncbi:MAG: hypothetical protein HKN51_12120 [Saprospiraceae bacterium]|nr:hypothetical protein [Saprospiraceae bacterium]
MQVRNILSNLKPEIKTIGDLSVVFVKDLTYTQKLYEYKFDAIVLEEPSQLSLLRKDNQLYLFPTFIKSNIQSTSDGVYFEDNPYLILNKVNKLKQAISQYQKLELPDDPQEQIIVKLLRYLISRSSTLLPNPTRKSNIGYSYALLEEMSIESNKLYLIKGMNNYVKQNYFNSKIIDKVNLCYTCEGSYLNFYESCTKCNSVDLKSEDLIHHFRCAYIGPESDYMKNDLLECPKCNHVLKHIGIDYDKPSEIHTCKSCNNASQETKMKAKCIDCSKENELDQLSTHAIYEYVPTEKGRQKSLEEKVSNQLPTIHFDNNDAVSIPLGAYELIKKHEIHKKASYTNNILELRLNVSKVVLDKLSIELQKSLLEELCSIVKPYLKAHDLITINLNATIQVLLIDYNLELSDAIADTIEYNLDKMIRDNGWTDQKSIYCEMEKLA